MKFSSKLALVAAASLISASAFAGATDPTLDADALRSVIADDAGLSAMGTTGGAYIVQEGTGTYQAWIDQDNTAGANYAVIHQTGTGAGEAMIAQKGAGNTAYITQK